MDELEDSFSVIFATNPDEEHLYAEIYADNICVAEVRKDENDKFDIRFVDMTGKKLGELQLDKFIEFLDRAKKGLK